MSDPVDDLKHHLRVKFGLGPHEPTDEQLLLIVKYISQIKQTRNVTDDDWKEACTRYCPTAGSYLYKGQDMSDLNMLLERIRGSR